MKPSQESYDRAVVEQERIPEPDAFGILERIIDAFFALDTEWRFTYVNPPAERLLHRTRKELLGKSVWKEFPEAVGSLFYQEYQRAVAEQTTVAFDDYYPPLQTYFTVHAYPSHDGLSVYFDDITGRKREEQRRQQRERRAAFGAEVGAAVNYSGPLPDSLQRCAEAMVRHLDAAFARIWTLNAEDDVLELQASAGMYTHLDGPHSRVPVGQFKIGLIAQERTPHLTNAVVGDPRVGDQEWARREGMIAFAGYPLLVSEEVVGVIAMFAREVLTEDTLNALSSVADILAQTIQRKRTEEVNVRLYEETQALNQKLKRAMTETHHRVKNNLQLIGALIDMQRGGGRDTVPMSEFVRLGQNVQALGVIHDVLTREAKAGGEQKTLSAKEVLEKLLLMLRQTIGEERILGFAIEEVRIPGRQMTSLALVANELVANALKHGKGRTDVFLRRAEGQAVLEVLDDGLGFPADFDPQQAANTGLELIENISRWDLKGETSYTNRTEGGARITVSFPLHSQ